MFKSSGVAIATVHSLLVVVDIVGNCLVCAIIKKHRDMRNPFNYLLVNLALADMLYATFITVSTFLRLMPNHPYGMGGTILCKLLTDGFLAFIAGMASVVTLLAIAAERYYAVIYPLGNVGRLTKCKLKVIIAGSWIFSLIVVTPSTLSVNVKDNACVSMVEEWMSKAYFLLWSAVVAVAIAIMAGMYSRIVYTLWFKRNPDNQLTFQQGGVLKVRKRVTLMGVTVTAIFGICWTPDIIAHLIDNFASVSIGELAYPVLHTLMLFSSAVNPFMYALVNKTFREKLKGMICCSCICFTGITRNRDYQLNVTSTIGTSSLE